jgi:hypothetical protein
MPRYTGEYSEKDLQEIIFKSFKRQGLKEEFSAATLPALADLNTKTRKDLAKVDFGKNEVSIDNKELSEIVGMKSMMIPHFLSKDAEKEENKNNPKITKYKGAHGPLAFLGVLASAPNQVPVFFAVYANYDGTLRAYMPRNGNSWDKKTKTASYFTDDKKSLSDYFDVDAIKKEIKNRIEFFGKSERSLSFIPDAKI